MNYSTIKHCDMVNGSGLRVSLFVSGCDHACPECFNPETHDSNYGTKFTEESYNEICMDLKESWCSGITLLGGDPLFPANREDILNLIKKLKLDYPKKNIWCYTGYTLEQLQAMNDQTIDDILNYIDVLLDGPYVQNLNSPNKHWVGSSNQHVYSVIHTPKGNQFIRLDED